mmetsp:Transcript_95231/g.302180  ORF Transcript_95231/g.302180 Transcript_95231/m.302180 type:complete len:292 (+) Transcript_95231:293-1168(+)
MAARTTSGSRFTAGGAQARAFQLTSTAECMKLWSARSSSAAYRSTRQSCLIARRTKSRSARSCEAACWSACPLPLTAARTTSRFALMSGVACCRASQSAFTAIKTDALSERIFSGALLNWEASAVLSFAAHLARSLTRLTSLSALNAAEANFRASGFSSIARTTTCLSHRMSELKYCSASPLSLTTAIARSLLANISGAAYWRHLQSTSAAMSKLRRLFRIPTSAYWKQCQSSCTASQTKVGSACNLGEACWNAREFRRTHSRTRLRSAWISGEAYCSARTFLAMAVRTTS